MEKRLVYVLLKRRVLATAHKSKEAKATPKKKGSKT